MKQQFIGLFHCKCGTSWRRDIGFFKRTPDMVFSLERKKVGNKVKQLPTIHHTCKYDSKKLPDILLGRNAGEAFNVLWTQLSGISR